VRTEGTRGHDVGGTEQGRPRRILWARASRQVAAGRGRSRRMEGGGHGVKPKDLFSKSRREGPVRDPWVRERTAQNP